MEVTKYIYTNLRSSIVTVKSDQLIESILVLQPNERRTLDISEVMMYKRGLDRLVSAKILRCVTVNEVDVTKYNPDTDNTSKVDTIDTNVSSNIESNKVDTNNSTIENTDNSEKVLEVKNDTTNDSSTNVSDTANVSDSSNTNDVSESTEEEAPKPRRRRRRRNQESIENQDTSDSQSA